MTASRVSREFFEAMYQGAEDPWNFAASPYELDRYETIIGALAGRRFRRAFEPGCSIGVLTERLAAFCDRVIAIDISDAAVDRARARCAGYPGVTIETGSLPDCVPPGEFDLVVFSEIGYYMTAPVLAALAADLVHRLPRGGLFLAAHWLGTSGDHVLTGDEVHEILSATPGLARLDSERRTGFRLDLWSRN